MKLTEIILVVSLTIIIYQLGYLSNNRYQNDPKQSLDISGLPNPICRGDICKQMAMQNLFDKHSELILKIVERINKEITEHTRIGRHSFSFILDCTPIKTETLNEIRRVIEYQYRQWKFETYVHVLAEESLEPSLQIHLE